MSKQGLLKSPTTGKVFLALSIIVLIAGFGLLGVFYYNTLQMQVSPERNIQDTTQLEEYIATLPLKELNETEKQGILYMREEEKLARDVYQELYDIWGSQIFSNIAHSEQTHMDAVLILINRYNLTDPVANDTHGVFQNAHLQELYNELVKNGSKSLEDAYRVGALIEEVDIIDLEEYIAKTDNEDIRVVYEFLERGSFNHLRAFVKQLDRLGVTYTPVLLDQKTYDEIISSTATPGATAPQIESAPEMINMYYFYGGIVAIIAGVILLVLYFSMRNLNKSKE